MSPWNDGSGGRSAVPERRPQPLAEATIPTLFSASQLGAMERCALSVLHGLHEAERLTSSPEAVLGTVIHLAMTRYVHRGGDVRAIFDELLAAKSDALGRDPRTVRLLPLNEAIGWLEWRNRLAALVQWAQHSRGHADSSYADAGDSGASSYGIAGVERDLEVPELRLRGRVDLIEWVDGELHITDWKTGAITDHEGNVRPEYVRQLGMYALMAERRVPGTGLRLWLAGTSSRLEVPWSAAARAEAEATLRDLSARFPAGVRRPAADLAEPGEHCRWCAIRQRCARYLNESPATWREVSARALDIWGVVTEAARAADGTTTVLLRDAAGRTAQVVGLGTVEHPTLAPGRRVWMFDLESSECGASYGHRAHPCNFHEHPSGPSGRWARRLRVFYDDPTGTWAATGSHRVGDPCS